MGSELFRVHLKAVLACLQASPLLSLGTGYLAVSPGSARPQMANHQTYMVNTTPY